MKSLLSLDEFSRELSSFLGLNPTREKILTDVPLFVQDLIKCPDFTRDLLERLARDAGFATALFRSIDPNDLTLYRDPSGAFSVRLFIWNSNTPYPPHDHGSWGIVGALAGNTRETKYIRVDKQDKPGYAELAVKSEAVLSPGQTTYVLPVDEGIHRMEPMDTATSLTLHVYGRPVRKGFIQSYHPSTNQVYRMYSPTQVNRVVSLQALGALNTPWAREILESVSTDDHDLIREEAGLALQRHTRS